jgi:fermentation-respiration switch protein FrsA (DUF1100 family)
MRVIVLAVIPLALVLLVFVVLRRQERIAYQPPSPPGKAPSDCPAIEYHASDGQRLLAWVAGDAAPVARLLVAFHGNAVEAQWEIAWARELHRRTGWTVMLAEYRGYGGLPGTPDYQGIKLDARAAFSAAATLLSADDGRIVYYGHSLGSAVAAELAVEEPPKVLILESPLTSARAMSRVFSVPWMRRLWNEVSRIHYDTELIVRSLDIPVWVAHGARDLITPVSMGRRVHAAALRKGELLIIRASHNDLAERGGDEYWRWITAALYQAV